MFEGLHGSQKKDRRRDRLTEEERAAIEAFDESKVQRIPQGMSSEGFVYDEKTGGVVITDAEGRRTFGKKKGEEARPAKSKARGVSPRVAEAVALAKAGKTAAEAAAAMGISTNSAYTYLTGTGLRFAKAGGAKKAAPKRSKATPPKADPSAAPPPAAAASLDLRPLERALAEQGEKLDALAAQIEQIREAVALVLEGLGE